MEKTLTLSNISATFLKDFDTFGKMDPFLEFTLASTTLSTEVASKAGREPKWKQTISITCFNEDRICVKAWDDDTVSKDFMGDGYIDTAGLKQSGKGQLQIMLEKQLVGTVYYSYTLKCLPPAQLLVVKSISCNFLSKPKLILKSKPVVEIECGGDKMQTKPLDDTNEINISWPDSLRVKLNKDEPIHFRILDASDKDKVLLQAKGDIQQFKLTTGSQKLHMIDQNACPLGELNFTFETHHLVNQQESDKNLQAKQKRQNQLQLITLEKIKGKMINSAQKIYFKISSGPKTITTQIIENAKKDFEIKLKETVMQSENPFSCIHFTAYKKDMMFDDVLGIGSLELKKLKDGETVVSLSNAEGKKIGDITVSLKSRFVQKKAIYISNIKLKLMTGADTFGTSQPYLKVKVGKTEERTETQEEQTCQFDKNIDIVFHDETEIEFGVWDEDVTQDDFIFSKKVPFSDFKEVEGDMKIFIPDPKDEKKETQISFHYRTINIVKPAQAAVGSTKQRASAPAKKQQIPVKKESLKQISARQSQKVIEEKAVPKKSQRSSKQSQKGDTTQRNDTTEKKCEKQPKQSKQESERPQKQEQESNILNVMRKDKQQLPPIVYAQNYGDKIFGKQSTATLQTSIHVYSMPKSKRFGNEPKYSGQPSYFVDTCFKPNSGKGVGFGFGQKKQFPEWMERNMKENPPPGAYFEYHDDPVMKPKGPTFGIAHRYYQKVLIPKQRKMMAPKHKKLQPISYR